MLAWITEHSAVLQTAVGLVTALVWVIYLHIIVSGLRRQRRAEILITLGGRRDLSGRILVSNLSLEPIYILDILLRTCTAQEDHTVSVAERTDSGPQDLDRSEQASLQTPLKTGDLVDIGRISTLLERAQPSSGPGADPEKLSRVDVTVVAVTAATSSIVAARRSFDVAHDDAGSTILRAHSLYARQIRSRRERRQIEKQVESRL